MSPSWPYQRVAVEATTIDLGVDHLAHDAARAVGGADQIGAQAELLGRTFCMPPNSTFDAVSEPVSATPSQPSIVPKKGTASRLGEGEAERGVDARSSASRAESEHRAIVSSE